MPLDSPATAQKARTATAGDNAVRDFMSLNKLEVLPWDSNEFMKGYFNRLPNSEECALLDRVADITTAGNNSFSEVRTLYESNSSLRMPADWEP